MPKNIVIPNRAAERNLLPYAALQTRLTVRHLLPSSSPSRTNSLRTTQTSLCNKLQSPRAPTPPARHDISRTLSPTHPPKLNGHDQENNPRNLQPQLMQHPSESPRRGSHGTRRPPAPSGCAWPAAFATRATTPNFRAVETLLTASILTASERYNDANLSPPVKTVPRPRASKSLLEVLYRTAIGGYVDQQLKDLMKELGEAINESLSDSEQIAEVVSRIKEGGYDIFLVLEATIGVSKQGEKILRQDFPGHHSLHQSRIQNQRSGSQVPEVPPHQNRGRKVVSWESPLRLWFPHDRRNFL